jgi:hypothetical protein
VVEPDELRAVGHHDIIYSLGSFRYPADPCSTVSPAIL